MIKKNLLISFFLLIFSAHTLKAAFLLSKSWLDNECIKSEKLYDYVQSCCSYLMGQQFFYCSLYDRKVLYDNILNDIRSTYGYQSVSTIEDINLIVHKWIIDYVK